jgi:hypothetical protein
MGQAVRAGHLIGLFSSIASGILPHVFPGFDTKHSSVRHDLADVGPVPVGCALIPAHCLRECLRARNLSGAARKVSPCFLKVSMARGLKCIAARTGRFDERSKVGVGCDGQQRKQ